MRGKEDKGSGEKEVREREGGWKRKKGGGRGGRRVGSEKKEEGGSESATNSPPCQFTCVSHRCKIFSPAAGIDRIPTLLNRLWD